MKKILLPTDFSENAWNAISYAVQLLKKEECIFYLMNTYTPVIYKTEYSLHSSSYLSLDEYYRKASMEGLEEVESRIKESFPNARHWFEKISSFNLLNEEIREQVKEKGIDLVIMGTKGATGADEILFGTHTVHAIKRALCPILAIPSGFKYRDPENILFPTDFEINYSPQRLQIFREIASENAKRVNILHVPFDYPPHPALEEGKDILSEYLEGLPLEFHTLKSKTVPEGIYAFQEQEPTDMLVMISNKHNFLENILFLPVINEIGFHVKVPFLVIPSGKYNT